MGWISNGTNIITGGVVLFMFLLALIMPLFFKKKSYYCHWICPLGSAQELAGKLSKRKISISQRVLKYLNYSQEFITLLLFFALWLGLATDITDYEPFSAFLFQHASWGVISIAVLSLVTAIFTPRPWCRFACPTGQLLNWLHHFKA